MLKLLKNADVYSPSHIGMRDILIAGAKIERMAPSLKEYESLEGVEVIDLFGKRTAPGYIDLHEHVTGGGGEQGPASRVPEILLSELIESGVTTVVGLLGTDGVTRSLENLLAKVRALCAEGITAFMLTGSYGCPSVTLTGCIETDMVLIDKVFGAKTAISDHRSSYPLADELIRIATQVRRGSMLSGHAGYVCLHMGDGKARLDPIFDALDKTDLPIGLFLPTHMNRNAGLFAQGEDYIARGGTIDVTAGDTEESSEVCGDNLAGLIEKAGTGSITLSSDGGGSMPRFNEKGECVGLTYASPKGLHRELKYIVKSGLALESALELLTKNPARVLGLSGEKGCLAEGADADILVFDGGLDMDSVFAKGRTAMLGNRTVLKGRFEV